VRQPPARQADEQLVEEAIASRLADPAADPDKLAEPLLSSRESYEPLLAERIRRCTGPEQVAAIELAGCVGTARSVPLLLELSRQPATHAAAVRALGRLADSEPLGRLAAEEPNADLQQELLAALVARQDARSVAVYLALVAQPQTQQAALAALHRVDRPPVEPLFQFLASPKREQRTAAAVALGSLDDPEVSARLIRMVVREGNRQEPLLALVASRERDAWSFVSLARRDPLLIGSVRSIEYRLKTFLL
jgi:HEAT repeat protein